MKEGSATTHVGTSFESPISDVKLTNDEMVTMRAIAKQTANWYPNEYRFISEELFNHLIELSCLVTKNTH